MTHELHESSENYTGTSGVDLETLVDSLLLGGNTTHVTVDTPSVQVLVDQRKAAQVDVPTLGIFGGFALTGVMSLSFAVLMATSSTPSGRPTALAFTDSSQSFSAIAIIVAGVLWLTTAGAIRTRLS